MDCHASVNAAVMTALNNPRVNGYASAVGLPEAREAIAARYNKYGLHYTTEDVFLTSGCSHALQMVISGAVSEGDYILLPQPGFSIYKTITDHFGIEAIYYPLLPDNQWQVDLGKVAEMIEQVKPRAWLINNPSNPCGSVYNRQHLEECLALAKRHRILVIADEIYEDIVFSGHQYIPMASLASNDQCVITCSGIAKRYMVPGWRLGWIVIHDPLGQARQLCAAFFDLAGLILGPCTLIQAALPAILSNVPDSYNAEINKKLEDNAQVLVDAFSSAKLGISVIQPQGTLYLMMRLPKGTDDIKWCQRLLAEENVLLLPGTVLF